MLASIDTRKQGSHHTSRRCGVNLALVARASCERWQWKPPIFERGQSWLRLSAPQVRANLIYARTASARSVMVRFTYIVASACLWRWYFWTVDFSPDIPFIEPHPIVKLSWIHGLDHSLASTVFAQSRIYLGSKSCASVKFKSVVCARTRAQKKKHFYEKKRRKVQKSYFLVFLYRAFIMGVINSSRSSIGLFWALFK